MGEDLMRVVSEILLPENVSLFFSLYCVPIMTLNPSRNVASP